MKQLEDENCLFSKAGWKDVVGEVLLATASDAPMIETPLEIWAKFLVQPLNEERIEFSLIQQAILGAKDLTFGGVFYRPNHNGLNDREDVGRLLDWLVTVDPAIWSSDNHPEGVQVSSDELAFAKEWFPELVRLYDQAAREDSVIVCEDSE
jgi:hypothetical protein